MTNIDQNLKNAIAHLESEFSKLQTGRANPALVEDIRIEQYGSQQPIKNVASVSLLDSQTITINPWDKSTIHSIAKAITDAQIGLNPQSMSESIIIKVPPLTEERRKELVKVVKKMSEEAKISIRNVRADELKSIKKRENDKDLSEDLARQEEDNLQKKIDDTNKKIEELTKKKEEDILKV